MATSRIAPKNIDEYIAAFSPEVQVILERVRLTISNAAPGAQETISYQIPAFTLSGALVYFAAFKNHIGFYPAGYANKYPEVRRYLAGAGTLRFPLGEPLPVALIEKLVKTRVGENEAKAGSKDRSVRRSSIGRSGL